MHNDSFNRRESKVDKIVKKFGKFKTLRSSVLKVERDKKVTQTKVVTVSFHVHGVGKPNEGRRKQLNQAEEASYTFLSLKSSLGLVESFIAGSQSVPISSKLAW